MCVSSPVPDRTRVLKDPRSGDGTGKRPLVRERRGRRCNSCLTFEGRPVSLIRLQRVEEGVYMCEGFTNQVRTLGWTRSILGRGFKE